MNDKKRIDSPRIERDAKGKITRVSVDFGPHHFFDVHLKDGKVMCAFGATHHGVSFDASEVNGDFEKFINEAMQNHPGKSF